MGVSIVGSGIFIPKFVVTNDDLAKYYPIGPYPQYNSPFDWSPQWIYRKLGIQERHFAFDFENDEMRPGYYDLDLGERAAREALTNSGLSIENVDVIIYVSSTPEYFMPDPACSLHLRLAAREDTAAFGLTSVGCGGCIYGMINAASLIDSGRANTVLVVASISVSSYMTQYKDSGLSEEDIHRFKVRDRFNASMFGDGAGALIFQKTMSSKKGFLDFYWGANGLDNPVIFEGGGSRVPATTETVRDGLHYFNMNGATVKNIGPVLFEKTVQKILQKVRMDISDIDFFVLHQVNYRILEVILRKLGIPKEKAVLHVDHYGNLDTATLAVGYHEALSQGKIMSGQNILFTAIGAGWQYGSAILRT